MIQESILTGGAFGVIYVLARVIEGLVTNKNANENNNNIATALLEINITQKMLVARVEDMAKQQNKQIVVLNEILTRIEGRMPRVFPPGT